MCAVPHEHSVRRELELQTLWAYGLNGTKLRAQARPTSTLHHELPLSPDSQRVLAEPQTCGKGVKNVRSIEDYVRHDDAPCFVFKVLFMLA